jgi:hypothetical protein
MSEPTPTDQEQPTPVAQEAPVVDTELHTEEVPAPEEEVTEEVSETPQEDSTAAEDTPDEDSPSEYVKYEDPHLSQAVRLLEQSKISAQEAQALFQEAVDTKDLSKVNKDALAEKAGKENADLILMLAQNYIDNIAKAQKEIEQVAHTIAGGEDAFNLVRKWAQDKANKDASFATELAEIRSLIDTKNPRVVKAALTDLVDMYTKDPNTTKPANITVGDSKGGTHLSPLTRQEYATLIMQAQSKGTYEKERASLWARRQLGMKQEN